MHGVLSVESCPGLRAVASSGQFFLRLLKTEGGHRKGEEAPERWGVPRLGRGAGAYYLTLGDRRKARKGKVVRRGEGEKGAHRAD